MTEYAAPLSVPIVVGRRVLAGGSPGVVMRVDARDSWIYGRSHRRVWIVVALDDGSCHAFTPDQVAAEVIES